MGALKPFLFPIIQFLKYTPYRKKKKTIPMFLIVRNGRIFLFSLLLIINTILMIYLLYNHCWVRFKTLLVTLVSNQQWGRAVSGAYRESRNPKAPRAVRPASTWLTLQQSVELSINEGYKLDFPRKPHD